MKKTLRSLVLLLMLVAWVGNGFAATGDKFTLVTSESDLKAGDVIIIVNTAAKKALGTTQNSSNRKAVDITITGTTATMTADVQEISLEGTSGAWYFNVGTAGYLYASSSSSNQLKTKTTKDDNCKASITFSSQTATIKFLGTNTRNLLKYNNSSIIFSCYANGQQAISIYKKASNKTATALTFAQEASTITEGNEATFALPALTLKAGDTELTGKAFTYTTDNEAMFEAYEPAVGPAKLVAGKFGTATITATYAGDDTYQGCSAKYTVTYKEAPKTTLTFSETEVNTIYGEEASFTAPTLSLKDAEGNDITINDVMYMLADGASENVVTINEETGAITAWKKPGTTTIAAMVDYNGKTYDATYTLNYKKAQPVLTFAKATVAGNVGEEADGPVFTLKAGEKDVDYIDNMLFESDNAEVATIDTDNGHLTFIGEGSAKITATFVGTDYYAEAQATYTVEVTDPNKGEVTFNFENESDYGYGLTSGNPVYGEGEGDVLEGATIPKNVSADDIIFITNTTKANTGTRFYSESLRVYTGSKHTVSAKKGYVITKVSIAPTTASYNKYKIGDNSTQGADWTGNAQSVVINYTGNSRLVSMTVSYTKLNLATLNLSDDDADTEATLTENNGKMVNVTLTRSLVADKWNTICLPFDVAADDVKNVLKAEGNVRVYQSEEGDCLNFTSANTMTAGVPYLVKPTESMSELTFEAVTISETKAKSNDGVTRGENLSVEGTFTQKELATDGSELFLTASGKFSAPAVGKNTMKGFRAYFISLLGSDAKINIDGEATSISSIATDALPANAKVYNLNGQYVGTSLDALPSGIYVVNGKKVMK